MGAPELPSAGFPATIPTPTNGAKEEQQLTQTQDDAVSGDVRARLGLAGVTSRASVSAAPGPLG